MELLNTKCTIYILGMFGYSKTEATSYCVERKPYAQHPSGLYVHFKPKGKRNIRCYAEGYKPSVLILEGWGHPEPDDLFDSSRRTKYASYDPRWAEDFDATFDAYLKTKGVTVLLDERASKREAA